VFQGQLDKSLISLRPYSFKNDICSVLVMSARQKDMPLLRDTLTAQLSQKRACLLGTSAKPLCPCVHGLTIHTSHQSSSKVAANSDAVDVVAVDTGAWLSSSSPPPLLLLSRRGCKVSVKASTEWLTISADNEPGKAWLDTLIVGQHVWFLLRSTNVVETVAKTSDVVHLVTVN